MGLSQQPLMSLDFTSITPAPLGSQNRSNYPRGKTPQRFTKRCTSGGFFTPSQIPDLSGYKRGPSLTSRFDHWIDEVCKTPQQVSLYFQGRKMEFNCNPGSLKEKNVNNAIRGMNMCDPMLYGFYPIQLKKDGSALSICTFPKQHNIGRSYTYSENFESPNKENPGGADSLCDIFARARVSDLVPPLEGLNEKDRSLYLAARLALENPALFESKKHRAQEYCSETSTRFIEGPHCKNILYRIKEIERVTQLLLSIDRAGDITATGTDS